MRPVISRTVPLVADEPEGNTTDSINDPGQSWNAVTVGAYTNLTRITEAGAGDLVPMADYGALSPFSTTSATWDEQWPLKPDVVFEGGNAVLDAGQALTMVSLSLLTTHHRPESRVFTATYETSAATALATRMAAQLRAEYPQLRPESIRGLMVHSANWTPAMQQMHLPNGGQSKREYVQLIQHCGFGVPDIDRALWSASNSLAMVVEEQLLPFKKVANGDPTLHEMQLHKLPWPKQELEQLGEHSVEMRVTLSYYIEPNPSARGPRSRYRYQSHGLRFDVKRAGESPHDFRARINKAARDEGRPRAGAETTTAG